MDTNMTEWVQDLDKADINVRQRARKQLIAYEGDISDLMIGIMCEQQGRRSWEAAIILSERRDPRALDAMKQMLTSRHPVLGQIAAETLAAYGNEYLEALIVALPRGTYMTQIAIVSALERIGDPRAVVPLIEFLPHAQSGVLLYTTIQALGTLGDPRAAAAISQFVDHPDAHVAKHARVALTQLDSHHQQ